MKIPNLAGALFALLLTSPFASCATPLGLPTGVASGAIVHSVYFELEDPGDTLKLVAACSRRLRSIPGIVSMAVGPREESQMRVSNNTEFDVSLTIVFESIEALESYLVHPSHVALVSDFTPMIASLSVWDSRLTE